jgi:hypothetical protein
MARRSKFQREKDLQSTARLYLSGHTQVDIADAQSVTQVTVSNDIKELQRRWLDASIVDFDSMRAQELAKIDALEIEYWDAWRRSKKDAETVRQEGGASGVEKIVRTKRGQVGDQRYLAGVAWCIEQRRKMFGLDAPQKVAVTDWRREVEEAGLSASDLFNTMVSEYMVAIEKDQPK